MKVLITGGTGLVGTRLTQMLLAQHIEVVVLSRSSKKSDTKGLSYALWNIAKGFIDVDAVCSAHHIIHLAGTNIADGRWTAVQKQKIIDSRVKSADLIFKTLKENKHQVKSFISASGADCYGVETTDKIFKESDHFGTDFLAHVCQLWETSAMQFNHLGIRTVCLRTGIVFAKKDSALQKMVKPISLGIGAPLGLGNQIMSFIHIEDLCQLYIKSIKDKNMIGAYNTVVDNQTNNTITKAIAKQLNKPLWFPNVPAFVLKLLFGQMASILLEGSAVDNTKIKDTGFVFEYNTLEHVLQDLL